MLAITTIMAAVLLVFSALVLSRALPAQNVALILGLLAACELALETVWNGTLSFGGGLAFWPAMVVLARMGARRMLRRRRQDWNYGVWLIFLASAAVALVQLAVLAMNAPGDAPLKFSVIRFAATAFCLFILSPWFILKLPQQP
jgi:hypothetical protein